MEERVPLTVMGLSYSHQQAGAYALVLSLPDGSVHMPVIIGATEAQVIAMHLENVKPPRPLTHDLFANCNRAFGIRLKDVFIYDFSDGIFSAEMTFSDGEREVTIDARTSDAVAMAMRTGAPISTTRSILEETGYVIQPDESGDSDDSNDDTTGSLEAQSPREENNGEPPLERYSLEELEKTLARLIEREDYEEAARVSAIIRRKKGEA